MRILMRMELDMVMHILMHKKKLDGILKVLVFYKVHAVVFIINFN